MPMTPQDLFEQHFDEVHAYVAFRLAPDGDSAADVVQEVFRAALDNAQAIAEAASARAWLLVVARNKVADFFRRRPVMLDVTQLALAAPGTDSDLLERRERAALVARTLRELPARYGALLEEKYLLGRSVRELAHERGVPEKTVESALARARSAFERNYSRFERTQESAR